MSIMARLLWTQRRLLVTICRVGFWLTCWAQYHLNKSSVVMYHHERVSSLSRKVRVSIVLSCAFNKLAASFELSLSLFNCPCNPHVLTEITFISLSPS